MSRMLPGRPLWPYGIFSGSTSMVLPLGRNVTLYFFVAGLYLTSSIYGFVPPIIPPKSSVPMHTGRVSSDFRELPALECCRNRAAHQQFRKMLSRPIQFVDAFA